jgi:dTDP-4-dehydrorhamnose 3,5-epimerase
MKVVPTSIVGCLELKTAVHRDARGSFVKTYQETTFREIGLPTVWSEDFTSVSARTVLRGLHFQTPPFDHDKLVTCLAGRILDVVLDLRKGSPTFGQHQIFELSGDSGTLLFIPSGLAHGFLALTEGAVVSYKVTSEYSSIHDQGVRWDSCGISWPVPSPVVSVRDASFPRFSEFQTPFIYHD